MLLESEEVLWGEIWYYAFLDRFSFLYTEEIE